LIRSLINAAEQSCGLRSGNKEVAPGGTGFIGDLARGQADQVPEKKSSDVTATFLLPSKASPYV
jgi:hypothetical protein